jgi:hypothetical protein
MSLSQVRHKLDLGLLLGLVQVRPHMAHGGGLSADKLDSPVALEPNPAAGSPAACCSSYLLFRGLHVPNLQLGSLGAPCLPPWLLQLLRTVHPAALNSVSVYLGPFLSLFLSLSLQ